MREQFLLDPNIVFLNHGSFGACPIPVFEVYQEWQRDLERQPVAFLSRRADALLEDARAILGAYVHADPDDLVFVPNATTAINTVARSLRLEPGDEVLATDHEYGAVDHTWQFVCEKTGAHYIRQAVPMPIQSDDEIVEALWSAVTSRTRVLAISHITSPTALIFPVAEICRRARAAGILTVIDGAHVPGQLALDLTELDADYYAGNCHKWLCAPKGSGFLYVRREYHRLIEPLVISWGWRRNTSFVEQNQWQGTRDIAAFLAVPAAIKFQQVYDWETVRAQCHALAVEARARITACTGLPVIAPDSSFVQMFSVRLPGDNANDVTRRLVDDYCVEVPAIMWNGQPMIRVSVQGYNTTADIDALVSGLSAVLRDGYTV